MKNPIRILLPAFLVIAVIVGIAPYDRATWLLENMMTAIFAVFLFLQQRRRPLSNVSWWLIFAFGTLHIVGAHYTYSLVPYNEWTRMVFGTSLNDMLGWQRNHFDRLVHFCYGLLLFLPMREILIDRAALHSRWASYFTVEFIMASSLVYELVEWGAAVTFAGDVGMAYLGTQGDIWDAHKDMLLATVGGLVTWGLLSLQTEKART
ncbi:MAG: DUF2238 domain-containing protein [Moraxellaceae bacterium]